ncbi:MAG: 3-hydroxyacyl-CoA dehydrogenase, partial [Halocynthiibacter sp.]
ILEEGKALRASDIDVMWLTGFAFPRHRGGIMHYADQIGLVHVYARICRFRQEMGEQWRPSDLLKDLAEKGGSFADI